MITPTWIVLLFVAIVAVSALAMAVGIRRTRAATERKKAWLRASFEGLSFDTPMGPVHGTSLTVVKIVHPAGAEVPYFGGRGKPRWDAFWYAVGPGPSYFLAICMIDTSEFSAPPKWAVRPLHESRMRAALVGDIQAQQLAFGEAVHV